MTKSPAGMKCMPAGAAAGRLAIAGVSAAAPCGADAEHAFSEMLKKHDTPKTDAASRSAIFLVVLIINLEIIGNS